jgi:hypothetical protein
LQWGMRFRGADAPPSSLPSTPDTARAQPMGHAIAFLMGGS